MARYEFTVTLSGEGDTPEDAWEDAVGSFTDDPGLPPVEPVLVEED